MLSLLYKIYCKIMNPLQQMIHQINKEAHGINKNLVQKTDTLSNVPMKNIYDPVSTSGQVPPPNPQPPTTPVVESVPAATVSSTPSPNITPVNSENTEKLIKQLISVEKKIDRFFNLIEKRVVKNAKEINIRIKLNEDNLNEHSNTEQE